MHCECLHSTPTWHGKGPRYDCVFVSKDVQLPGIKGISVVRIKLFFSFDFEGVMYPCVLVEWYAKMGRGPDWETRMWKVKPDMSGPGGWRDVSVLHLDAFMRGAHLLPSFGGDSVPLAFTPTYSLDPFQSYYVNKYIDHHAHEIAY